MQDLRASSLTPSTGFYIACGTVAVDRQTGKLLVIRDRHDGKYKLPRGRKDWGERLEDTATREGYEETGIPCRLLPVPLATRATPPSAAAKQLAPLRLSPTVAGSASPRSSIAHEPTEPELGSGRVTTTEIKTTPPAAPNSRAPERTETEASRTLPDLAQAKLDHCGDVVSGVPLTEPIALMQHFQPNGALAVVFWYVAEADSAQPVELGTQMPDEDYEAVWVRYHQAADMMCNEHYATVVRLALELVVGMDAAAQQPRDSEEADMRTSSRQAGALKTDV